MNSFYESWVYWGPIRYFDPKCKLMFYLVSLASASVYECSQAPHSIKSARCKYPFGHLLCHRNSPPRATKSLATKGMFYGAWEHRNSFRVSVFSRVLKAISTKRYEEANTQWRWHHPSVIALHEIVRDFCTTLSRPDPTKIKSKVIPLCRVTVASKIIPHRNISGRRPVTDALALFEIFGLLYTITSTFASINY